MEFTTLNSTHEEMAEAIRGAWGKDATKDCTLVYIGQAVIGLAKDVETLNTNVKCNHYDWIQLANGCFLAILK